MFSPIFSVMLFSLNEECFPPFLCLFFAILITYLGEEGVGLCAAYVFVCLAHVYLFFFHLVLRVWHTLGLSINILILLQSEWSKLCKVLAILSAVGLNPRVISSDCSTCRLSSNTFKSPTFSYCSYFVGLFLLFSYFFSENSYFSYFFCNKMPKPFVFIRKS